MNATDLLQRINDGLSSTASVKSVFGEPIHVNGKTIVPVATVAYGFGGGFGNGTNDGTDRKGEGGGGGGGVRAFPAGALEITDRTTRFIPFRQRWRLVLAFSAAALAALVMSRQILGAPTTRAR